MTRLLSVIILILSVSPAAGEEQRIAVPPIDESFRIPQVQDLRNAVLAAVLARDEEALLELASNDILLSFWGTGGHSELQQLLSDPAYWLELETVFRMGGAFLWEDGQPASFCGPYTFVFDPPQGYDLYNDYELVFITGRGVRQYAKPSIESPVINEFSGELLVDHHIRNNYTASDEYPDLTPGDLGGWMKVERVDGSSPGWIRTSDQRQRLDFRFCLTRRKDGDWHWDNFVAGD